MVSRMSWASIVEPVSSKPGTAGTQEPGVIMHLRGTRSESFSSSLSASSPATFMASCGSQ